MKTKCKCGRAKPTGPFACECRRLASYAIVDHFSHNGTDDIADRLRRELAKAVDAAVLAFIKNRTGRDADARRDAPPPDADVINVDPPVASGSLGIFKEQVIMADTRSTAELERMRQLAAADYDVLSERVIPSMTFDEFLEDNREHYEAAAGVPQPGKTLKFVEKDEAKQAFKALRSQRHLQDEDEKLFTKFYEESISA